MFGSTVLEMCLFYLQVLQIHGAQYKINSLQKIIIIDLINVKLQILKIVVDVSNFIIRLKW